MSLPVTTTAFDRKALMKQLTSQHKAAPKHKKFDTGGSVAVTGVVIERFENDRGKTDVWIIVSKPTACYEKTGEIKNNGVVIGHVDKDADLLSVSLRQSKVTTQRLADYAAKGWQVEKPLAIMAIEQRSAIRVTFETNMDHIPDNALVSVSLTASCWIGDCDGPYDPSIHQTNERRASRFVNGQSISIIKETDQYEMAKLFENNPTLAATKMPLFDELCKIENWDQGGMRKKSEGVFFLPVAASPESDFAMAFALATPEGQGCSCKARVDANSERKYEFEPKDGPAKTALRLQIDDFQHASAADLMNNNKQLLQFSGGIWDTTPFYISDRFVWPQMVPRILSSVDMVLPFRVDLEKSSGSSINRFPDAQATKAQYAMRIMSPIVAMAPFVYHRCVPVSPQFVSKAAEIGLYYQGEPTHTHRQTERPLLENLSEMSKADVQRFMASDRAKECVFRVMTMTNFNDLQADFVEKFIAEHEGKIDGPYCEGLLDPNWFRNPEKTLKALYNDEVEEDDLSFVYTDDHPLMQTLVTPNTTMRDFHEDQLICCIFAVDKAYMEEIEAGVSEEVRMLAPPPRKAIEPVTPATSGPPDQAPGAPKASRKRPVEELQGDDDDDDDAEASVSDNTRSKVARKNGAGGSVSESSPAREQ